MKERIRRLLLDAGAAAVGFAEAGDIDPVVHKEFERWIEAGYNGEMEYLGRHVPLRKTTESVLPGSRTVISLAFSYVPEKWQPDSEPCIAAYAYSEDYHIRLKEILSPTVARLKEDYGGKWRICIDSAPIAERYWACRSGIGRRGLNGNVIVEGCGSMCFLVEILTTCIIEPDMPSISECERCGACMEVCPGGAIRVDGTVDASRCVNYLTIEKKSEFTQREKEILRKGAGFLYGCDRCLRVCPHNHGSHRGNGMFLPLPQMTALNVSQILEMDEAEFKKRFNRSPLAYAGWSRLLKNALVITATNPDK